MQDKHYTIQPHPDPVPPHLKRSLNRRCPICPPVTRNCWCTNREFSIWSASLRNSFPLMEYKWLKKGVQLQTHTTRTHTHTADTYKYIEKAKGKERVMTVYIPKHSVQQTAKHNKCSDKLTTHTYTAHINIMCSGTKFQQRWVLIMWMQQPVHKYVTVLWRP